MLGVVVIGSLATALNKGDVNDLEVYIPSTVMDQWASTPTTSKLRLRSEEVRLTEAPLEPPKYILGDTIELYIYLRHRKNIERVQAVFAPRTETDSQIVFEGTPQPWRREGYDRISRVEFNAEVVTADWVYDEYVCTTLVAYYPATRATPENRGERLGIPEELRFKIVAEPMETPAVEGWDWGNQP